MHIKSIVSFSLLLPTIVLGRTFEFSSSGKGLETLMGGVGVARLGSLGSLHSNPSLLAWLPEAEEFISTNQLIQRKFEVKPDGYKWKSSPEVIPLYAVSGYRSGDLGLAYGFSSNSLEFAAGGRVDGQTSTVESRQQFLSLNLGAGWRISQQVAIGGTLILSNFSSRTFSTAYGQESGQDFHLAIKEQEAIWTSAVVLGAAYVWDDWAFGWSSRLNILKFGHTSYTNTTFLSEQVGTPIETTSHSQKNNFKFIGSHQLGFQKKLLNSRFFFDYTHTPQYRNDDGNLVSMLHDFALGVESPMIFEKFKVYSGLGYVPEQKIKNEDDSGEKHRVFLGGSLSGKHSIKYLGIGYIASPTEEASEKTLNFGTKFEY